MADADGEPDLAVYEMALAEARAGCQDLMAQPEMIRKNVGAMLGFAAVAASLFGLSNGPGAASTWAGRIAALFAVVAFIVLGVCAVLAMRPIKVRPGMDGKVVVSWGDAGAQPLQATRDLALHFETIYQQNKPTIQGRFHIQNVAAIALGVAVVALAIRSIAV